jgi:large subunit ribosomal protein L21
MFAVIETGGKQYRVQQGDVVRVESLAGDAGDAVAFEKVLMIGDGDTSKVGNPTVEGARVKGTVVDQGRGKKILIYTYKRRQNSNRKQAGHRQNFTAVQIDSIEA